MARKYFGTDGVRGKVGEFPITPDFVMKLGWAAGKVLSKKGTKKVLIGKDTRISGYMLESALEAGLSAAGLKAILMGPMPTPAVAYLTRTFRAEAGIVISASHNPFYDNGIKFFSADGTKLPDDVEMAIEAELDHEIKCVESADLGKAVRIEDAVEINLLRFDDRLRARGDVELAQDFRDVRLDRRLADIELVGYLLVQQTLPDHAEHAQVLRGERREPLGKILLSRLAGFLRRPAGIPADRRCVPPVRSTRCEPRR